MIDLLEIGFLLGVSGESEHAGGKTTPSRVETIGEK